MGMDNPFVATPTLRALLKHAEGDADDPEVASWLEARAEAERRRAVLGLVDLEEVMLSGITEPEMLIPGMPFVKGVHHVVFGRKENGKTWLMLALAARLMSRGENVVWVDKEMGARALASRLKWIGLTPETVGEHFTYLDHPMLDGTRESCDLWRALLEVKTPAVVVIDAQTEVLADANLNENLGTDVSRWASWYLDPASRAEIATVMIDHTGHDEQGRARGSGHKGNAAKVELLIECQKAFSTSKLGLMKVSPKKNSLSAPIPDEQFFEVGADGTPDGDVKFVFRATEAAPESGNKASREREFKNHVEETIRNAGVPLNATQVAQLVGGNKARALRTVAELANSEFSHVKATPEGRSVIYSWDDDGSKSDNSSETDGEDRN